MKRMKSWLSLACAGLVVALGAVSPASAADGDAAVRNFPERPLRFILPLGPGSSGEVASRHIADRLGQVLGQPAVAENRPGGQMQIALHALLSAPADGHTLMMISPSPMVVNPIVVENWPFDVQRDIRPLVQISRATPVYVTSADSKYKTLDDVIAAAKAAPGTISVANYSQYYESGVVSLEREAGVRFSHIRYKGAAQSVTDVIGQSVDVAFVDIVGATALVRDGRLRALAVTSPKRHADLPEVPSVRELGFKNADMTVWIGFGVHSKTPEAIAQRLEAELIKILRSPEYVAFNETNGRLEIVAGSGADLARQIKEESERVRAALKN